MVASATAVAALLLVAALSRLRCRPGLAHVCRGGAVAVSLAVGWHVATHGPQRLVLHRWLDLAGRPVESSLRLDAAAAVLLLLAALWAFVCALLVRRCSERVAALADVAAVGAVICVLAGDVWLALAGCQVLLLAAFVYKLTSSMEAIRSRRVLFLTSVCSVALIGSIVPAGGPVGPWLTLLAAAVLAGAWPFHSWFEDLGADAAATAMRLLATVSAVGLVLAFTDSGSLLAPALLLVSMLLSVGAALAAQDLFRAQMHLASAQGALVLLVASVDMQAALLLLTALGLSQVVQAGALAGIQAALPDTDLRLVDLGGLAPALPWSRWLTQIGAAVVTLSPATLWAAARMADRGWAEGGPAAAAAVAAGFALPTVALVRLSLAPFAGPIRHTALRAAAVPAAPSRVTIGLLAIAAAAPAAVAWWLAPPVLTVAAGVGAGALVVMLTGGMLLWRRGPRQPRLVEPAARRLAADGFAVAALWQQLGRWTQATGRLLWTMVDDVLFTGTAGLMGLGARVAGWALAWLHDGWSGWALATATGTAVIVLWAVLKAGQL